MQWTSHTVLRPDGPVFRQQDVHHLADQVVAQRALKLVAAESPVVIPLRSCAVVRSREDCADEATAELTGHAAVVVQKVTHRLASLVTVGIGVGDWHRHQEPLEEVGLQNLEAAPHRRHGNHRTRDIWSYWSGFHFDLRLRLQLELRLRPASEERQTANDRCRQNQPLYLHPLFLVVVPPRLEILTATYPYNPRRHQFYPYNPLRYSRSPGVTAGRCDERFLTFVLCGYCALRRI